MVRNSKQNNPRPATKIDQLADSGAANIPGSASAPSPGETTGEPVRATFRPDGKGGGILQLRYSGMLAHQNPIWVRLGERRGGSDWLVTRDVQMEKAGEQATARITFAPGTPTIEGASFAFFSLKDNKEEIWDSAGHPFGFYVLDAKTGQLQTR